MTMMATKIKMEVFFTVSDSDVVLEAGRLVEYMKGFKPGTVWNRSSDRPPFYERCEVCVEKKSWNPVI
jgi:hypothetical protein